MSTIDTEYNEQYITNFKNLSETLKYHSSENDFNSDIDGYIFEIESMMYDSNLNVGYNGITRKTVNYLVEYFSNIKKIGLKNFKNE